MHAKNDERVDMIVACLWHVSSWWLWSWIGALCNMDAESLSHSRCLLVSTLHTEMSSIDLIAALRNLFVLCDASSKLWLLYVTIDCESQ